jgi:hypothetical protein
MSIHLGITVGMKTIIDGVPEPLVILIENLRTQLCDPAFKERHRSHAKAFTRRRLLTFPVVMLFILQKTARSVQRHLHEFFQMLALEANADPVSAGAWTHARAKLQHTAFIELNTHCLLPAIYSAASGQAPQLWRGHRLLGIDSSILRLPDFPELYEQFTPVEILCQLGSTGVKYPEARMSVLYDVLNRVGVAGRLEPSSQGEVSLAIEQLLCASAGDVLITDRGYTGYLYLASVLHRGLHFVARCSKSSFSPAQELFRMDRAGRSMIARVFAPNSQKAEVRRLGLPLELTIRFLSLRLSTGELEVLATSLLDEKSYPTQEFQQVYGWRWNHETFYFMMKSRLDLENFSGQTAEAIRQDFHSTLLMCNLESILGAPARALLKEASAQHQNPKLINHAGAYHAIKSHLLELLYSQIPADQVILKLQKLFLSSPVSQRKDRKVPRRKASLHRSYYFQRAIRKTVF